MSRPQSSPSAERVNTASRVELLLAAERGAASHELELLAELGERAGGPVAYLAAERTTRTLVVGLVSPVGPGDRYVFSIARELDDSIPGPTSTCQTCGRSVEGWTRFCACGNDLSGVTAPDDGAREALREHVHQATVGEFEILGAIPYTGSAGLAFFGRSADSGSMVALWVRQEGVFEDASPRLAVATSEPLTAPSLGTTGELPTQTQFATNGSAPTASATSPSLPPSSLGSGLLARQPTPRTLQAVAVPKVCPHCGSEYETGSRFCPADGTALKPKVSADPLVGQVIAERYIVLKRLGEGGMGRVYLAEHVKMNRQCAIKVMSAGLVNDAESAKRFAREASSAARVIHPNVAAVFDYGESDGLIYIVMEYVDGEPLSRIIEREKLLQPHRALDLARQVLDGLAAAHELGIVHRDLKPDNIIITQTRSGREVAKVVDFGIAKAMQEGEEALTRTGLVIGTPEFMSPEQLLGDPVDSRSDIYSLGCILYQMLTGTPAFQATTREQMIKRRLTEEPPHPRTLNAEISPTLDTVVHRMLARSPQERYRSASDVRDRLAPDLAMELPPNPLYRPTPRSAPTLMLDVLAQETTERMTRRAPSRRAQAVGGIAAALLVVGAAAGLALRGRPHPSLASQVNGLGASTAASSVKHAALIPEGASRSSAQRGGTTQLGRDAGQANADGAAARPIAARTGVKSAVRKPAAATHTPKLTPDEEAMHALINAFRSAIQTEKLDAISAVYPALSPDQQAAWTHMFNAAKDIRATVHYRREHVVGNTADVDFTIRLSYWLRKDNSKGDSEMLYHALMSKDSGNWVLKELKPQ